MDASSSRQSENLQSEHDSDHVQTDALQHDDVYEADQQPHADTSSPASLQQSTSPSSTHRYAHGSSSPEGSDNGSRARETPSDTQADSALFTQLELLNQECQEKEALINKLSEQLSDWEELHVQLQEKERFNRQYAEALQAAESTIAYLTACSLDNQRGFMSHSNSCPGSGGSDAALHSRFIELQKALQEKEDLNNQLIELLNMAEKAISSFESQEKNPEIIDLRLKMETALQPGSTPSDSPRDMFGYTEDSMHKLQQHADTLQEALWEQNRINAELQEKLWAAAAVAQHGYSGADQNGPCSRQIAGSAGSLEEKESKGQHSMMGSSDDVSVNEEMTKVLMNCLSAAESVVASLAAHCTNTSSLASGRSSQTYPDLQTCLDQLQRALQEREELRSHTEPTQTTTKSSSNQFAASAGAKEQPHQELHHNLCLLYKIFSDHCQRISELQASLQEDRGRREESKARTAAQDAKGLPPNVQLQLETLHKALREKKKTCKNLEEKLATAQSIITKTPSPETARRGKITHAELFRVCTIMFFDLDINRFIRNMMMKKRDVILYTLHDFFLTQHILPPMPALEQDDKGVQVDLQDLGYETSVTKSENDREESSSTGRRHLDRHCMSVC